MTTMCSRGYIYSSTHKSWEAAADKVEQLQKKGLDAFYEARSTEKPEFLVFQSKNKRKTKEIIYDTKQVYYRNGWETRLRSGGKTYFSWVGAYFSKKEYAEKDMKKLQAASPSGLAQETWGYKVFRTPSGWGVFAEV